MSKDMPHFAYILSCGDPKIRQRLTIELDRRFGGPDKYFWLPELGGVKNLSSPDTENDRQNILKKIKTAAKIHPFELMLLINHSDCGAYRLQGQTFDDSRKEEAYHAEELRRAEEIIKCEFPGLIVERHYFLKKEQRMAW
jgi:hypothetical protein